MRIEMKYLLGIVLFSPLMIFAQTTPEQIVHYTLNSVSKVEKVNQPNVFYISAPYGKPILSASTLNEIQKRQVISVELVYTQFSRSANFNQEKLNITRLQNLRNILPKLFSVNNIDWKITQQTGAKDYATGQAYFHGFIIGTRTSSFTAKDRDAELKAMEDALKVGTKLSTSDTKKSASSVEFKPRNLNPTYDKSPVTFYNVGARFSESECDLVADAEAHIKFPMEAQTRRVNGKVQAEITVNKNGDVQDVKITEGIGYGCEDAVKNYLKTMPKWTPAKDKQGNVNSYITLNFWFITNLSKIPDSEMDCDLIVLMPEGEIPTMQEEQTSKVVSAIFDRNKNWNNVAIVCDVTGSMGPYISDLMKWFRMNSSKIKHFTFFNDGDMKSQSQKVIGATGGIYSIPAANYETVEKEMYTGMRNGFGGDLPENDVEALLEAEKNAPFSERLVWIADNYATPRDVSLLPQVKKPVSIIICAQQSAVSLDYLNIARKINASLHTLTADFPDLSAVKDGESITVDGKEYRLSSEKFVRVY